MIRIPLVILLAAVSARAEDDPYAGVLGTWFVKTSLNGREIPAEIHLSLTKDGKLEGRWKSRNRDMAVGEVKYAGGVLEFVRELQGRRVRFRATIKDGKLAGVHRLGEREIPVAGRRLTEKELNDPDFEFERNSMRAAPRDAFPVLDDPKMTTALEAKIGDGAYVIGVVVNKEARAYPVRVMGVHELVNDTCGGDPIAVSW